MKVSTRSIVCVDCGDLKPVREFYKRTGNGQPYGRCKPCHRSKTAGQYSKTRSYWRERLLGKKYGITLKRYEQMFEEQGGACAMCRCRSDRSLSVDHDHKTKKIRGLLCTSCNALLGFAQEDARILRAAIAYLESSHA